jgi:hypothetical protein
MLWSLISSLGAPMLRLTSHVASSFVCMPRFASVSDTITAPHVPSAEAICAQSTKVCGQKFMRTPRRFDIRFIEISRHLFRSAQFKVG